MNMKHINKILLTAAVSFVLASCVDKYESGFKPEKPAEVISNEQLNSYDVLSKYVNHNSSPNFKLGTNVTTSDFLKKETVYSLISTNFEEMAATATMMHGSVVKDDGSMDFSTVSKFIEEAGNAGLTVFGNALCSDFQQNSNYLNAIIAPIPGDKTTGTTDIIDFESNSIGDTYPVTANGSATVVADPAGKSGNVLNIAGPASYSYPIFHVVLPDGLKLGDYKTLIMDFYGTGSTGLYGSGMRLAINDVSTAVVYGGPSTFGCPDGSWGRGLIALDFANLNLTDTQKALTEFDLIVGSGTGSGNYYIDNIKLLWEKGSDDYIRPPQEKKEILTNAMSAWIEGIMGASNGKVKAWDVIKEPMDDANPQELRTGINKVLGSGEFYWQDYLGADYAVEAFNFARNNANNGDLLFISDYGLESNLAKCHGLIDYVAYIESKGATVDGISTQMHLTLSSDKDKIASMFKLLAATGKMIRISELKIALGTTNPTVEMLQEQADMYKSVITLYNTNVPTSQQYGISLMGPQDTGSDKYGLWNTNFDRKPAYAGFADGLSGN